MTEIERMIHIFKSSLFRVVLDHKEFLKNKRFRSGMKSQCRHTTTTSITNTTTNDNNALYCVLCVCRSRGVCVFPDAARMNVPEWHREETTGSCVA